VTTTRFIGAGSGVQVVQEVHKVSFRRFRGSWVHAFMGSRGPGGVFEPFEPNEPTEAPEQDLLNRLHPMNV
jgi:hypothetical protein